jgi:hypothetical protein
VEELEKVIDSPLHVLYLKQLTLLREKALKTFKSTVAAAPNGGNEYEALLQVGCMPVEWLASFLSYHCSQVDDIFRREAEESTRQNPDWDYSRDLLYLKQSLGLLQCSSYKELIR